MKNYIQGVLRGRQPASVKGRQSGSFASVHFAVLRNSAPFAMFSARLAMAGGKLATTTQHTRGKVSPEIALLIILILMLTGTLPVWPHSLTWGYGPSAGLALVVFIVFVLMLIGRE